MDVIKVLKRKKWNVKVKVKEEKKTRKEENATRKKKIKTWMWSRTEEGRVNDQECYHLFTVPLRCVDTRNRFTQGTTGYGSLGGSGKYS